MSRPQVVKKLWEHIHARWVVTTCRHTHQKLIKLLRGLQNPDNKKEIICDDKFRAMFNVNKIDMFKMNKELSK